MRFTYSIPVYIRSERIDRFYDKAKKRYLRMKKFQNFDIKNQKYMLPLQCGDLYKNGQRLKFW